MPADPTLVYTLGAIMLVALIVYLLSGGADFGGGIWEIFAAGPRAKAQQQLIEHAIAPIWEANHVWLILVVVLCFVCFPSAFAVLGIALHIPLTILLMGIVFRGAAFVFRAYGLPTQTFQRRWGVVFSVTSLLTPLMLGVTMGTIASGAIRIDRATGQVISDLYTTWLQVFPWAIGGFTVALCAFLAAVYLVCETQDRALQEDFRRRALIAGCVVGATAWLALFVSRTHAPLIFHGLTQRAWSIPFQIGTGGIAIGALAALWQRRYRAARVLAIAQVTCIMAGWGASQFPYLIAPDLTFLAAAAPTAVLRPVLIALACGSVLLIPALGYLFFVFKRSRTAA